MASVKHTTHKVGKVGERLVYKGSDQVFEIQIQREALFISTLEVGTSVGKSYICEKA